MRKRNHVIPVRLNAKELRFLEEQVVKNHGRCKYQKGSIAGPDIFSVTIQFHKNVNHLSNFINLYYTHAIPKIQPQPHLREKKETAILEKQI